MKKAKKVLVLFLCAVLLIGATIAGTVAYLTDSKAVRNTFTVGDIEIYLDETDIDGSETGEVLLHEGRDFKNEYKGDNKLVPGKTVTKDPTVWVKEGSEPAYLRMVVTVGGYDSLLDAFAGTDYVEDGMVVLSKLVEDWDYATWGFEAFKTEDGSATYEFRYLPNDGIYTATADNSNDTVDYYELSPLFTGITVPGTLDNEKLAYLANVTITVEAHAIQSQSFKNADEAWDNF